MKISEALWSARNFEAERDCCGRSLASDRKNAKPRARHRSRQFSRPAESARLLPDRQIPASRHISRSDSRLYEFASSSGLSVDDICALLHLQLPSPLPATTPASLTYLVITAMLRIITFSPVRWCCLNGLLDSSGFEGCEIRRGCLLPSPRSRHHRVLKGQRTQFCRAPQISLLLDWSMWYLTGARTRSVYSRSQKIHRVLSRKQRLRAGF